MGIGVLVAILLLVVFHRPLVFEGTRYFVVRTAQQQHLAIDYEIDGTIFSSLSVKNLRARPTEPGPVQRLEIGSLVLEYSLWDALRDGLPALLRVVAVRDVFVELTPAAPLPPEKTKAPQAFKFPAVFPALLELENINVLVHGPQGATRIEALDFSLYPERPGRLRVGVLDIPGVRRWENVTAVTTFHNRRLVLGDLILGEEIRLREFVLDLSELEKDRLAAGMEGRLWDAPIDLEVTVADLNARNTLDATVALGPLDIRMLAADFQQPASGLLQRFAVSFRGEPDRPETWDATAAIEASGLTFSGQEIGTLGLRVQAMGGVGDGEMVLERSDDQRATARLNFSLRQDLSSADLTLAANRLAWEGHSIETLNGSVHVASRPSERVPDGLSARVSLSTGALTAAGYHLDSASARLAMEGVDLRAEEILLRRGPNTIRLHAASTLPRQGETWTSRPVEAAFQIVTPDLRALAGPDAAVPVRGRLEARGQVSGENGVFNGALAVDAGDLEAAGVNVRTVEFQATLADNEAALSRLNITFDDANQIHARGKFGWDSGKAYSGEATISLDNLSIFQKLAGQPLGGKLTGFWQGEGRVDERLHAGSVILDLTEGRLGELDQWSAHLGATYSENFIDVRDLHFGSPRLVDAALSLFWKENRLQVWNLRIGQGETELLTGQADLPLNLAALPDAAAAIPPGAPVSAVLKTTTIDLATLARRLGQKSPPSTGSVRAQIEVGGTLETLHARALIEGRRLRATAAGDAPPSEFTADIALRDRNLTVDSTLQNPWIEPLVVRGSLPFDAVRMLEERRTPPGTPLDFEVRLPASSLAFLPSIVPHVRQVRGTASVDVAVRGTIGRPELSGSAGVNLTTLRFTEVALPPVDGTTVRLDFAGTRIALQRAEGRIGGGTFHAQGAVDLADSENPSIDLRLGARQALVLQNDNLSVRTLADLRVLGRLRSAAVTGTVWLTRSRFFRNIEILPIGLPGRPAPQPPGDPVVIRLPDPPLRDWTFDLALRTADPFLVRSNLATGRVVLDLRLLGTGYEPWLDGTVHLEELTASLPFSRLLIEHGQVFFSRREPFVPRLQIRGTSVIRDYDVSVLVTGTANRPEAVFTSNPPLPQAEVVALLATGMTTSELTRDPNALAGRAAILAFQQLYQRLFRRNRPPENEDSFFHRIQWDVGAADPRTGRQATTIRLPLSENVVLTGGLDVGGNFQGQVRYLVRFR